MTVDQPRIRRKEEEGASKEGTRPQDSQGRQAGRGDGEASVCAALSGDWDRDRDRDRSGARKGLPIGFPD